jgi:hypothetical protein
MSTDPPNFTALFVLVRKAVGVENEGDYGRAASIYDRAGKMASELAKTADDKTKDMVNNKAKVLKQRGHALKEHLQTYSYTLGETAGQEDIRPPAIDLDDSFKQGYEKRVPKCHLPRNALVGEDNEKTEFSHLRYLPVLTSNPSEFTPSGYALRASQQKRKIKFLINITMYNEDEIEMNDTLQAICTNL